MPSKVSKWYIDKGLQKRCSNCETTKKELFLQKNKV